jgi:hypothetical protein
MKKLFISAIALVMMLSADAQGLNTPQPSPTQTVKQNFGLSSIELSYSRPGVKGRKYLATWCLMAMFGAREPIKPLHSLLVMM